jgi:hypothetical protein
MVSIPQVGSVLCGLVLLFNVSHAAASMQAPNDFTHNRTVMGDLVRVEYGYYFLKGRDGKEVRLHADKTTLMFGQLKQGDRVEAEVTEQNHALQMRSIR